MPLLLYKTALSATIIQSHGITATLYRHSFDQALQYPDPLNLQKMNGNVDSS